MCSEPITTGEIIFACRKCNQCIAARKNDWVARCMAEKDTSQETVVIDLTYRNNSDGTKPVSAIAFRYKDVQDFLKRLREAYFREYGFRNEIRYIIAGERGSKRNRVHWHLVLFADRPISTLGKWEDFYYKPIKTMLKEKMVHWSLWPHGHVYPQIPDQGGMMYVLKYALKDQFNSVNSKGTMRFTKSEDNGASMFRMSKQPPIGFRWLERYLDRLHAKKSVPPKLEIKIPDYKGFWWPKGYFREYLLDRLHDINESIKIETGRDAPQWNTLLASVSENEKDWEGLVYGQIEEKEFEFQEQQWRSYLVRGQDGYARAAAARDIRGRCGGPVVCKLCWRGLQKQEKSSYRDWYFEQKAAHGEATRGTKKSFERWYRAKKQINPFCLLKDIPDRGKAFRA